MRPSELFGLARRGVVCADGAGCDDLGQGYSPTRPTISPMTQLGELAGCDPALAASAQLPLFGGLDHLPQLLLQIRDLVAHPGGDLEVELGRRLVHLLGEFLDQIGQLGGRHVG